ncbi:MAG: hypothetical protein HFE83_10065 [Lachnospiraceae bacterium]|jgi:hypothetical protein|nr:hypothetical protein [Lachnospiraceae bacterium]
MIDQEMIDTMKTLLSPICNELNNITNRLDKMDTRLDKVDIRLDKMDIRLDKIDIRLDKMEQDVAFNKKISMIFVHTQKTKSSRKSGFLQKTMCRLRNDMKQPFKKWMRSNRTLTSLNELWQIIARNSKKYLNAFS